MRKIPVRNSFEYVAGEWRNYRPGTSSELPFFLERTPDGAVVLDAGCAHGRNHAKILEKASFVYAFDVSPRLVEFARQNAVEKSFEEKTSFFVGNIKRIPLPDASFDCVFCMAVFHLLKTRKEREKALHEFARVLKKKGLLFLSVWNVHQQRFKKLGRKRNVVVPWTTQSGRTVHRLYHFFEKQELELLARQCGFDVENSFWEKDGRVHAMQGADNLCAILRKK